MIRFICVVIAVVCFLDFAARSLVNDTKMWDYCPKGESFKFYWMPLSTRHRHIHTIDGREERGLLLSLSQTGKRSILKKCLFEANTISTAHNYIWIHRTAWDTKHMHISNYVIEIMNWDVFKSCRQYNTLRRQQIGQHQPSTR